MDKIEEKLNKLPRTITRDHILYIFQLQPWDKPGAWEIHYVDHLGNKWLTICQNSLQETIDRTLQYFKVNCKSELNSSKNERGRTDRKTKKGVS